MEVHYGAIVVAVIASMAFSALFYFLLNKTITAARATKLPNKADPRTVTTPNKLLIDFVRTFALALVVAYLVYWLQLQHLDQAVLIALWLWAGFPVMLFTGLVIYEHFPVRLAVIHVIDWLVKLLIITNIIILWP